MAKGKHIKVDTTVENALSLAGSEIGDLWNEMNDWRDSMEDKFSSTEKYERVSEAADTLENSELESRCEALAEAIRELSEGKPFVAGCPEHVVGTVCLKSAKCGWKGEMFKHNSWGKQTITRHSPPKTIKRAEKTATYFGSIGNQIWYVDEPASSKDRASTLVAFDAAAAEAEAENLCIDTPFIVARIPDEPEILPIEGLDDLLEAPVSYTEFQPYKGKSCSRADRLGNAITAAQAAIEVVRTKIETKSKELPTSGEGSKRLEDVLEAVEEVENGIGELEGVEFPGMYG